MPDLRAPIRIVDGRYEIVDAIGHGAYGVVYRARDRTTGQDVAVKLLRADVRPDAEPHVRMQREARALGALAGTSAVRLQGAGTDRDGKPYIAMELLRGIDLERHLEAIERAGGRMGVAALVRILDPVASTLEAAHGLSIVHRDLKPANIFLVDPQPEAGVRLLDFGLVKLVGSRPVTKDGSVAGSPDYIAPEAWAGRPAALDHRIDVYALGAIVFRALSGRVPFEAPNLARKLVLVAHGQRPSLHALRPDLPVEIDEWVAQALAADPARRFLRAHGLWAAFRGIVGA